MGQAEDNALRRRLQALCSTREHPAGRAAGFIPAVRVRRDKPGGSYQGVALWEGPMTSERPFVLHITWTCYGNWLPGDRRGYVSNTLRPEGGFRPKEKHPRYTL